MPRMGMRKRTQIEQNILCVISAECAKLGYTRKDFEKKALFSPSTYNNRKNNPGTFTLSELCTISRVLNTTVENLLNGRIAGT